jgi:hypothetical protein
MGKVSAILHDRFCPAGTGCGAGGGAHGVFPAHECTSEGGWNMLALVFTGWWW